MWSLCHVTSRTGRALLVTADGDGGVRLWDTEELTTVGRLDLPGPIEGLCTLPDGRLVIAGSEWVCTARIR